MSAMKQALRALRLGGGPQNEQRASSPDGECRHPSGPDRTESANSIDADRARPTASAERPSPPLEQE